MIQREASSFRDRAGFVFWDEGHPFRHVAETYRPHWERLLASGLLEELQGESLLLRHRDLSSIPHGHPGALTVLRPEKVPFISYPYEWSFSQLKDAALATLRIQKRSLAKGMMLRDASAFNIQFLNRRPILIDTLSFGLYEEGEPWAAYRQFCRHFLAPLALMARVHPDMGKLLRPHLDGIPLDLASRALPARTKLDAGLAIHIHVHARAESKGSDPSAGRPKARVSKTGMLGLVDSLERTVQSLSWRPQGTVWADYYADTNYSESAMSSKREIVRELLAQSATDRATIWDLGANTGEFSRIASEFAGQVLAFDVDPGAVERHYRADGPANVLPLVQDLTNPSPGLGWDHRERGSLESRANADIVMGLALIHHLAIGNNVPLDRIAEYFARFSPILIVEFVPKADSQVQRLLSSREDIFDDYTAEGFEAAFGPHFRALGRKPVADSQRTIYLFERREKS